MKTLKKNLLKHYKNPDKKHTGKILDMKNGFSVIECKQCGFKHVMPLPTKEELRKLYKNDFYSIEKPQYIKDVEKDEEWWEINYKNYYEMFGKHCKGHKLLEIGSGPGLFLKCGKWLGWDVTGIEPSKQAAEHSRKFGIKVLNEFFDENNPEKYGKFDVIYMNMVIEHVPDPTMLINKIKPLLKQNGIICIISPNDYNPLQNMLKNKLNYKSWWVAPPQHINYFDFSSIKKLLKKCGFKAVEISTTFPMEFFLLSGENYIGNDTLGKTCHAKRKIFEINMYKHNKSLLNKLYKNLAFNNLGREFIIIGKINE